MHSNQKPRDIGADLERALKAIERIRTGGRDTRPGITLLGSTSAPVLDPAPIVPLDELLQRQMATDATALLETPAMVEAITLALCQSLGNRETPDRLRDAADCVHGWPNMGLDALAHESAIIGRAEAARILRRVALRLEAALERERHTTQ